ncbi:hypothetical protein IMG5_053860 [Ichthyophthirius multifiliis]|uniref:Uncharacterized protein n=1 Tax=Ichthyophthirius multifiliis TaxID=5932 RepID=G0QMY9_ICHMU|nr:hypothetical protein IMG5_053860 [Ichthyophthirius multifiliis]EGR33416.1 hypothetical protein IMG5_053860 [Ichthyophthirius multifiliis]|eukprot:XP_004037402.1 hypothetical protein IMG5_053860 [Ichthyophthirius multifiliis]
MILITLLLQETQKIKEKNYNKKLNFQKIIQLMIQKVQFLNWKKAQIKIMFFKKKISSLIHIPLIFKVFNLYRIQTKKGKQQTKKIFFKEKKFQNNKINKLNAKKTKIRTHWDIKRKI